MITKDLSSRGGTIRNNTIIINNDKTGKFPPPWGPKSQVLPKPINLDPLGFIVEGITRKACNINSRLGVLKLIDMQRELPNIETVAIIR